MLFALAFNCCLYPQPRLFSRPSEKQEAAGILSTIRDFRSRGIELFDLAHYVKNEDTGEWRTVKDLPTLRKEKYGPAAASLHSNSAPQRYQQKEMLKRELCGDRERICFELSEAPPSYLRFWYMALRVLQANKMVYFVQVEDEIAYRRPTEDDPIDERRWPLEQRLRFYRLRFNGYETGFREMKRHAPSTPRLLPESPRSPSPPPPIDKLLTMIDEEEDGDDTSDSQSATDDGLSPRDLVQTQTLILTTGLADRHSSH